MAHGIRTLGSAALTLCHVAMGAAEAYHTDNLMPWDVAAGVLIIRESGGVVIDTDGKKKIKLSIRRIYFSINYSFNP